MPKVRNRITGLIHDVPANHPSLPPQVRALPPQVVTSQGDRVQDTLAVDDFYLDYELVIDEEPKPQPKAK